MVVAIGKFPVKFKVRSESENLPESMTPKTHVKKEMIWARKFYLGCVKMEMFFFLLMYD